MSLDFCYIWIVGSEFGTNKMKTTILSSVNGSGCWCNRVGDIFAPCFGPLTANWALFKHHSLPEYCCWPYQALYDQSVSIFWWLLPADHLKLVSWTWQTKRSQANRTPLGCGGTGKWHHRCSADKAAATVCSYPVNMGLLESMPWKIKPVLKANRAQCGANKGYLIMWPLSVHFLYLGVINNQKKTKKYFLLQCY